MVKPTRYRAVMCVYVWHAIIEIILNQLRNYSSPRVMHLQQHNSNHRVLYFHINQCSLLESVQSNAKSVSTEPTQWNFQVYTVTLSSSSLIRTHDHPIRDSSAFHIRLLQPRMLLLHLCNLSLFVFALR